MTSYQDIEREAQRRQSLSSFDLYTLMDVLSELKRPDNRDIRKRIHRTEEDYLVPWIEGIQSILALMLYEAKD